MALGVQKGRRWLQATCPAGRPPYQGHKGIEGLGMGPGAWESVATPCHMPMKTLKYRRIALGVQQGRRWLQAIRPAGRPPLSRP
jgi:hypothetical protein